MNLQINRFWQWASQAQTSRAPWGFQSEFGGCGVPVGVGGDDDDDAEEDHEGELQVSADVADGGAEENEVSDGECGGRRRRGNVVLARWSDAHGVDNFRFDDHDNFRLRSRTGEAGSILCCPSRTIMPLRPGVYMC